MDLIHLEDRAIIRITGRDTHHLLQGLITNNMDTLIQDGVIYSALLSPQGKYQYDFFLFQDEEVVYCDILRCDAEAFVKKLTMYRLRADVTFEILHDMHVLWSVHECSVPHAFIHKDPRHLDMGYRIVTHSLPDKIKNDTVYHIHRIQLGLAEGAYDAVKDKTLLLEMHYDAIHAIDFHKGCYVGQEVTARSKYRANIRKKIYVLKANEDFSDMDIDIIADDTILGERRSFCANHALALLHSEKLQHAIDSKKRVLCNDIEVRATLPNLAHQ